MADKFRKTYPTPVTFSQGELPNNRKLSALGSQARNGLDLVEHAVGDLWNQAGDPILIAGSVSEQALMIPNLARALGASKFLGPRIPKLAAIDRYACSLLPFAGQHEAVLDFPPAPGNTTWTLSLNGGVGWATIPPEANLSDVDASGKWYVDYDTGWVFFYDVIANFVLYYEPVVLGDLPEHEQQINVIPPLTLDATWTFKSCKIEYANLTDNSQGYTVYLPPRGPHNTTMSYSSRGVQANLEAPFHTFNYATTPDAGDKYFFQSPTAPAAMAIATGHRAHYRYNLPAAITDNWSGGALLPTGLIYLWDKDSTGTILEGLTYRATSPDPYVDTIVVSGEALDDYLATAYGAAKYPVANLQNSSHASALYPSGGLYLITVGLSVSEQSSLMLQKLVNHDHGAAVDGMPSTPVSHGKLMHNFDPLDIGAPGFHPSTLSDDWHPQYLHRKGLDADTRDNYNNGMLGDLFLTSTNSTSYYNNLTANSHAIRFGHKSTGPAIRYDSSSDKLVVTQKSLRLSASGARYYQNTPNHWWWIDITPGAGHSAGGVVDWAYITGTPGVSEPYWENVTGGGTAIFNVETSDWPEGAQIIIVEVDLVQIGAIPVAIYVDKQAWPAHGSSGLGRTITQFLDTSAPAPHTFVNSGGAGRQMVQFTLYSPSTTFSHATDKLVISIVSIATGDQVYGVSLYGGYSTVCKWTP